MLILSTSTEHFFLSVESNSEFVCVAECRWMTVISFSRKKTTRLLEGLRRFYRCIQSLVNCHSLKIWKRPKTQIYRQSLCRRLVKISTALINSGISGAHMQIIAASKIPNSFGIFHKTLCVRFSHRFIALIVAYAPATKNIPKRKLTFFSNKIWQSFNKVLKFQMFELCMWIREFVFLLFDKTQFTD